MVLPGSCRVLRHSAESAAPTCVRSSGGMGCSRPVSVPTRPSTDAGALLSTTRCSCAPHLHDERACNAGAQGNALAGQRLARVGSVLYETRSFESDSTDFLRYSDRRFCNTGRSIAPYRRATQKLRLALLHSKDRRALAYPSAYSQPHSRDLELRREASAFMSTRRALRGSAVEGPRALRGGH